MSRHTEFVGLVFMTCFKKKKKEREKKISLTNVYKNNIHYFHLNNDFLTEHDVKNRIIRYIYKANIYCLITRITFSKQTR